MADTPEQRFHRGVGIWNEQGLPAYAEALWHPDVEYVEDPKWPGAQTIRGREQVVARFAEYEELLGHGKIEPLEVHGTLDEAVAIFRFQGTGTGSGAPVDHVWAYRISFDGDLMTRFQAYFDPDEALREAGLESSAP